MSNAEDLNRLTACSLVLLGHIFYVLGNHRVRIFEKTEKCLILFFFLCTEKFAIWEEMSIVTVLCVMFPIFVCVLNRKATIWWCLPCSWQARSQTCLFSCGPLRFSKVS